MAQARGLEADPNSWVEECAEGSVKTLTEHLRVLQDYVKGSGYSARLSNET